MEAPRNNTDDLLASSDAAEAQTQHAAPAAAPGGDDEWRTEGSEYLGRAVRRTVFGPDGEPIAHSDGAVAGWLDADASDFLDEGGTPAALYHVRFTSGPLAGDAEDLEVAMACHVRIPSLNH